MTIQARKSSFCTRHSCCCVEVVAAFSRDLPGGKVLAAADGAHGSDIVVRNSQGGPEARFTPDEWRVFLRGAKAGEFDIPDAPSA